MDNSYQTKMYKTYSRRNLDSAEHQTMKVISQRLENVPDILKDEISWGFQKLV